MTRDPLTPSNRNNPDIEQNAPDPDLRSYVIPSPKEGRTLSARSLPPSPMERVHPLMDLPVAGIYQEKELQSFQRMLVDQPILVTFADLSAVNIANSCGLTKEVDALVSKTKKLLTEAYQDAPWRADAPGFDEVLIMSGAEEGRELNNYKRFNQLWNEVRDELLPLSDPRVQAAESLALLREEMYQLQREYEETAQKNNTFYSVNGFSRWLEGKGDSEKHSPLFFSKAGIGEFRDNEGPLSRLRRAGELALQVAKERHEEEIIAIHEEAASGPTVRRVLSLVGGHVKMDVILTPFSARAAADHAEARSSQLKKGVPLENVYGHQEEWRDRRSGSDPQKTASYEEVEKILELQAKDEQLRRQIQEGLIPKEEITQALHQLIIIAHSDRELGEGIIRYENGGELPVQILVGRTLQDKEPLTLIQVDLTAGGAFTKAFGFSRFGNLFRNITEVIKERTNADLIIRHGGGKLYVLTATPLREIGIQALTSAIDKAGNTAHTSDTNRGTTARIDYGIRTALLKELSELLPEHAPPSSPVTDFLSARVKIHAYRYNQAHTVQDLIESF
jgi:hypothetical protein